jgi:hypothetical protein
LEQDSCGCRIRASSLEFQKFIPHGHTILLKNLPEVYQRFIQVIDPYFEVWIFLCDMKCYATTTKEWFAILIILTEVRKELVKFRASTGLTAWVA